MPTSKADRDELINDLTVYAKLLNESDNLSRSFAHVYEVLTAPEYSVSLQTFYMVMKGIPLTPFQQERLSVVEKLVDWTHPHMPDFAPFSALWHLCSVEEGDDIYEEIEDEGTTTTAVQTLFSVDDDELIEALDHDCVLVRAAAAIAGSSEEFMDSLGQRSHLRLEDAIFYGAEVEQYIYSSEPKEAYERSLADFSGDMEDAHLLQEYPSTSTECRCISGWTAVENYFTSLQFFWLEGKPAFGDRLYSEGFAYWSTRSDVGIDAPLVFDETTFFSVALPTKYRPYYQIQFALGTLVVTFTTIPGYPRGDWETWFRGWDERIDMLQSFLERFQGAERNGAVYTEQRKHIWEYRENITEDGSVEIIHQISTLNDTRDAYSAIEPLDFDSGFYYLRNEIFGI